MDRFRATNTRVLSPRSRQFRITITIAFAFCLVAATTRSGIASGAGAGASMLAAGGGHSCVVTPARMVKCWGLGGDGELGNASTESTAVPVMVSGLHGARSVAAGAYHTCALLTQGTVQCWGYNFHGELGNGTRHGPDTCTRRSGTKSDPCSTKPVAVKGLSGVIAIAAGAYHSCALLSTATVKCWGYDAEGQLGDGTTKTAITPVAVTGLSGVRAIAAGGVTSCAVLTNGTVKCWGNHFRSTPTSVAGIRNAVAIAAGYFHECALLAAGTVECWGTNAFGQLGNGTFASSSKPVPVIGLTGITAVAGGEDHSCALSVSGSVHCWGYDQWGQIGTRPNVTPATSCDGGAPCHPKPVRVNGLAGVAEIATGFKHSCALLASGTVKCFGYNGDGELGNHTHTSSYQPVTVNSV